MKILKKTFFVGFAPPYCAPRHYPEGRESVVLVVVVGLVGVVVVVQVVVKSVHLDASPCPSSPLAPAHLGTTLRAGSWWCWWWWCGWWGWWWCL